MADAECTTGKAPAFQLYPKDFLSDEKVRVMTLPERGAYITLLCLCWLEGSLPSDVGRLSRLCGVSVAAFQRLWPAMEPCFRVHSERQDRLIQPRMERERQKQAEYRQQQADKGRASGAARNRGRTAVQSGSNQKTTETKSSICDLQSAVSKKRTERLPRFAFEGQVLALTPGQHEVLVRMLNGVDLDLLGDVYPRWDKQLAESGEPFDVIDWTTRMLKREVGIEAPSVPTDADRRDAEGAYRRAGGCTHQPGCADRESCLARRAVQAMLHRTKPMAVRA